MPGRSLSRASFGMTMGLAGGGSNKHPATSNTLFQRSFLSSSLCHHPRHSDDAGGGIPYYKRPNSLLPKGQANPQEIPQSCLLRNDGELYARGQPASSNQQPASSNQQPATSNQQPVDFLKNNCLLCTFKKP